MLVLITTWESKGVTLSTITEIQLRDAAPAITILCVAGISILYVLVMVVVGFVGVSIPPRLVSYTELCKDTIVSCAAYRKHYLLVSFYCCG